MINEELYNGGDALKPEWQCLRRCRFRHAGDDNTVSRKRLKQFAQAFGVAKNGQYKGPLQQSKQNFPM